MATSLLGGGSNPMRRRATRGQGTRGYNFLDGTQTPGQGTFSEQEMGSTLQFKPNSQPTNFGTSGGQGQASSNNSLSLLAPGTPLTKDNLQPFLGGQGRVKIDPYTGKTIDPNRRKNPFGFISDQLVTSPALQEAQTFKFENLGENLAPVAAQGLLGAGQNALSQSGNFLNQGVGMTQAGGATLLGTGAKADAASNQFAGDRTQALNELQQLQKRALAPDIDPAARAELQAMADQRKAEILSRFDEGGDVANIFQAQRGADLATLAARGVLDSTTAANTFSKRDTDFAALANQLLGNAAEQSRQDILKEREGVRSAATAFGGIQGSQASSGGSLLNQALGINADVGGTLGQLGIGQSGIGADLARTGIAGLSGAADTSLAGRNQEANLQLGELGQRLLGSQTALQNIQSLINNRFNRNMAQEQFDLQQQLAEAAMAGPSFWERAAGAVGGFMTGGLPGAFIGGVRGI